MAQVTHFFAGANSGSGFQNLFSQVLDLERATDLMILKGGPGVGKNTFMRQIGRTMEQAGTPVEYLWCSGDPASLDGVVLPALGCAVVDGTAPHVVEPRYPAAVDRYVDLGRFYDLTGAKTVAEEVRRATKQYKAAYVKAYHSLHAARLLELESVAAAAGSLNQERWRRRVTGILGRELKKQGAEAGTLTRRFLGSMTHRGYVWRFDTVDCLCPRVYEIEDRWERAGEELQRIMATARQQGWNCIACMAPEEPERIEHLLIPGLGLAFVTSRREMTYPGTPYRRLRLDAMGEPEEKKRLKLEAKLVRELRKEGMAGLEEAKQGHDALEAILHPYVDFEQVSTLAALEAGRLLSRIS